MAPGRARNDKRHSFTKRLPQQQQDPASLTERPQALPSNSALPNQVFPNESINNSGSGGNGNNVEFPGQRFGCPFCVIRDNDLRVQYEGAWTLSGGASRTTHSTVSSGASLSLKFNGTGIVVFGTVPASNGNMRPPSASYMVDDQDPVITTAPIATRPVPDQPLFGAMDISGDVEHTLVMRIIDTETPYTLEYFFVFPSPNGSHPGFGPPKPPITTAAPPTSPTPYSTALPSANPVPQSNDHMVRVLAGLATQKTHKKIFDLKFFRQ
ncbi:hypothetical protein AX16_005947 [Volvariella volvacea WC 439]|nr:hypothetical protein AX16_005947 [Volvariella volvacea WC 439]